MLDLNERKSNLTANFTNTTSEQNLQIRCLFNLALNNLDRKNLQQLTNYYHNALRNSIS